jgi:hypothetical protein
MVAWSRLAVVVVMEDKSLDREVGISNTVPVVFRHQLHDADQAFHWSNDTPMRMKYVSLTRGALTLLMRAGGDVCSQLPTCDGVKSSRLHPYGNIAHYRPPSQRNELLTVFFNCVLVFWAPPYHENRAQKSRHGGV